MTPEQGFQLQRDAFSASTTYVDANFRKQWEDGLRMFQSQHPMDSKYNSEAYKFRSRIFRPKTRSAIRKNEAAAAAAFFSNLDVVNISAENDKNPAQVSASKLYKALLQYRLTKQAPIGIPWFLTLIGGLQDAMTVGVVCSYQHWRYRERIQKRRQYVIDSETGQPVMGWDGGPLYEDGETRVILEDRPVVELRAVENLRIDPAADWTDPVNTSPYVIDMIPMYLGDLREMGKANPKTGEPGWKVPEEGKLVAAATNAYDSTRQTREGNRQDSKEAANAVTDYSIVWVHKNIMRKAGEDFCFYTLGTETMLSDPQSLEKVYFHGIRPYAMGCAVIETHKIYPSGLPQLGRELQKETNEIANSRLDNVKLVMNKRYIVKRNAQVDLKSLVRNVAASITLANDPTGDVKTIDFADVTSSSYAEQDRLNMDYDELLGNFSSSSVGTNRKLNETVGGMALIAQGANQLTEYTIRCFTETWVEPVLRQLVLLEKNYETDETIIKLMGEKLGQEVTDEMLDTDVELNVNVGMGATDPIQRINRLLTAARSIAEIAASGAPGVKMAEISKEVFGAIGYRDGGRFYDEEQDPQLAKAMGMVKALQNALGEAQQLLEQRDEVDQIKLQEMAIKLKNESRKVAAEIDNLQAQALEHLTKAGVSPSAGLVALGAGAEMVQ